MSNFTYTYEAYNITLYNNSKIITFALVLSYLILIVIYFNRFFFHVTSQIIYRESITEDLISIKCCSLKKKGEKGGY